MKKIILIAIVVAVAGCQNAEKESEMKIAYPETKKGDVVDTYFGHEIADPYRWLEDDMAEDTKD